MGLGSSDSGGFLTAMASEDVDRVATFLGRAVLGEAASGEDVGRAAVVAVEGVGAAAAGKSVGTKATVLERAVWAAMVEVWTAGAVTAIVATVAVSKLREARAEFVTVWTAQRRAISFVAAVFA